MKIMSFSVYKMLKEKGLLSGESAAKELSISRNAILKKIEKLRKAGIDIEGERGTGYKIVNEKFNEYSLKYELEKREIFVPVEFGEWDSTNNQALKLIHKKDFTGICAAKRQLSGKGRLQRKFLSGEGGIYFSISIKPSDIHPSMAPRYVIISALAVASALEKHGVEAMCKWPNDVLVEGKKICGILLETFSDFDKIYALVSGIGVNISNDVSAIENAVNLVLLTGKNENGNEICADIVKEFFDLENTLKRQGFEPIKEKYLLKSITIGKNAKISKNGEYIEGFAEGLDDNGFLVLKTGDGKTTVFSGDVV